MMNLISKILIKLLVLSITPQAARHINRLLIRLLDELADKTKTEADDQLVRTFEHFLKTRDHNGTR